MTTDDRTTAESAAETANDDPAEAAGAALHALLLAQMGAVAAAQCHAGILPTRDRTRGFMLGPHNKAVQVVFGWEQP